MKVNKKESKLFLNLHKRLEIAVKDYSMIKEGDHVLAALSGGKDSSLLVKLLARKKILTTNNFSLSAVFVSNGKSVDRKKEKYLSAYCEEIEVPFSTVFVDFENILEKTKGSSPCYLCSRKRRMAIFQHAENISSEVISFGHHRDDFIETFMMNLIYGSYAGTMKPFQTYFKGKFRVIRPMVYIHEKSIKKESSKIPVIFSDCEYEKDNKREYVRDLLKSIYKNEPGAQRSLFRSLFSVPHAEYFLKEPSLKSVIK